jgi:CDP-diacylglycerol--serine O-phosphatidyltransferase
VTDAPGGAPGDAAGDAAGDAPGGAPGEVDADGDAAAPGPPDRRTRPRDRRSGPAERRVRDLGPPDGTTERRRAAADRRTGTDRRRAPRRASDRRRGSAYPSDDGRRGAFRLVSATGARVVRPGRLVEPGSRARAMLPSFFTLVNLLCGFSSVLAALNDRFVVAAALIAVSIVFDIADGAVARAVGSITPFGLQFDSLADLISFGVAPAVLLYTRSLADFGWVGWFAAGLWMACAAFRLARFNVTVDPLADKRYFIGLPSPGAAGVVLATVIAFGDGFTGYDRAVVVALAVGPALLMASSFRFRSFRDLVSPKPGKLWVTLVFVAVILVGLALVPVFVLCAVAYTYVALAPLGWLTRGIRARMMGPEAVAPPRHRLPSVFFPEEPTDPS